MRLWHEHMLPRLPRQQLLGQHRECAALRSSYWVECEENLKGKGILI